MVDNLAISRTFSKDKTYHEVSFSIETQTPKLKEELQKSEKVDEETI